MKKTIMLIMILHVMLSLVAMEYIGSPLVSETCTASAVHENTLYMVTDWGLMIYNVANDNNPVLANKFPLNKGRGGIYATITGGMLVISGKTTSIYDISTPEQPTEIYNLDLPYVTDCTITDDLMLVNLQEYETTSDYSFSIYDKSLFPALEEVFYIDCIVSHEFDGNKLFLCDYIKSMEIDSLVTIKQFNLELNGSAVFIDSLNIISKFDECRRDIPYMELYNGMLYAKTENYVHSINTENFSVLCSAEYTYENEVPKELKAFTIADNYLYSNDADYWDISDPSNITYLDLWTEEFCNPGFIALIAKLRSNNNNLYVPCWEYGFFIFDIDDPTDIELVNWHNSWNAYKGVAIKDNYLFVTSWYALDVIDICDPTNPVQVNSIQSLSYLSEIIIEGDYAYVGTESGLMIYDISDPTFPNLISNTQMHSIDFDIEKHRNYIYGVGVDSSGNWLTITDVSDVANPIIELQLHDNENLDYIQDLIINNEVMYITDDNWNTNWSSYSGGLRIYDVLNSIEPTYLTTCNPDTTSSWFSVTIKENTAYLSGTRKNNAGPYWPQTWVVDISDPSYPEVIQFYDDPIRVQKAVIAGDYRYAGGLGGETIYDISDPQNPILTDDIEDFSGGCRDIIVKDGYIYSAKDQCINIYYTDYYNVSSSNNTVPVINISMLSQNYPNPFNPETIIRFSIPADSDAELTIYNIKGQKVKTLLNDSLTKGAHSCVWNGQDSNGKGCASGLYFYKLSTEQASVIKKMILMK